MKAFTGVNCTFQFVFRPPAKVADLAGKLIQDVLVVLAGRADPAAAHLPLPDHLYHTAGNTMYNTITL